MELLPRIHTITPAQAGSTVLALAEELAGTAGHTATLRGGAWLDGRRVLDTTVSVAAGATLALRFPPGGVYAEVDLTPDDVAYEDEWLIVLHKGSGWYSGATPWDVVGNTLAALGSYLVARDGATLPLHLAHQLDRDTSGLLLVSKAPVANGPLQAAFADRQVTKHYRCLCCGVPLWTTLEVCTGHGRAAGGRWQVYPLEAVGHELPMGGGRVRLAHSSFAVESRLIEAALLRAELHTGRTHQIRLHLAHAGVPLLGDRRYGGPAHYAGHDLPGHMLHAEHLRLAHPITGATLELTSPLPALFTTLLHAGRG